MGLGMGMGMEMVLVMVMGSVPGRWQYVWQDKHNGCTAFAVRSRWRWQDARQTGADQSSEVCQAGGNGSGNDMQ